MQALAEYGGAVLLVSHDSHLVDLVADRLWLVAGGTCRPFDGDLAEYRGMLLEAGRAERRQARDAKPDAPAGKAEERRRRAEARAATAGLRKAVKAAEARLEALQAEKQALHERLADPALYDGAAQEVAALNRRAGEIERDIEACEAQWLEAQEALEAAGE